MSTIPPQILALLACPASGQPLAPAPATLVADLNAAIAERKLRDLGGSLVHEPMTAGLLRADGQVLYRVVAGVAVMGEGQGILADPGAA